MNLTRNLRTLIVDRFRCGESIETIAKWYGQTPKNIESVIRAALIVETAGPAVDTDGFSAQAKLELSSEKTD